MHIITPKCTVKSLIEHQMWKILEIFTEILNGKNKSAIHVVETQRDYH